MNFIYKKFIRSIGEEDILTYRIHQLSVSPENTILHYLHLDVGEGVYLAPFSDPAPRGASGEGSFHAQIIENFRAAAQIIHRSEFCR